MKKSILTTCLLFCFCFEFVHGQIVLEHTYPPTSGMDLVELTASGQKYYSQSYNTHVIKLYNLDHTLWKTITLPIPAGYSYNGLFYINDKLFNNDDLVEVTYMVIAPNGNPYAKVVNEILDSVLFVQGQAKIIKTTQGYKLLLHSANASVNQTYWVYSLPGSLPCKSCSNPTTGLGENDELGTAAAELMIYPNPSQQYIAVDYRLSIGEYATISVTDVLGNSLLQYTSNTSLEHFSIPTINLASGAYYLSITTSHGKHAVADFIITK